MSDSYQAIYDAVRSRIQSADVAAILREHIHLDGSWAIEQIKQAFQEAAGNIGSPSAVYRPHISKDGSQWCVFYGHDGVGVRGFGKSPALAMADFDRNWFKLLEETR